MQVRNCIHLGRNRPDQISNIAGIGRRFATRQFRTLQTDIAGQHRQVIGDAMIRFNVAERRFRNKFGNRMFHGYSNPACAAPSTGDYTSQGAPCDDGRARQQLRLQGRKLDRDRVLRTDADQSVLPISAASLGLPSQTLKALGATSASFVQRKIASRSCWATKAMMPTFRSLAPGHVNNLSARSPPNEVSRRAAPYLARH